jgi:putative membrane protein
MALPSFGVSEPLPDVPPVLVADRLGLRTCHGWVFRDVTASLPPGGVRAVHGPAGRGIAPLFFAIALWVFGIVAFLLLDPLSARARASTLGTVPVAVAGFLPPLAGALVAAAVLYMAVDLGLGLDPARPLATVGLLALTATAFIAIAHALRVWLGGLAGAAILVLLVLQLTTSAGVYPVETLPAPFAVLHPLLPMSYVVDGMRVTLTDGSGAHLLRDVLVRAGFAVAAFAATLVGTARKRRWTVGELKPELIL